MFTPGPDTRRLLEALETATAGMREAHLFFWAEALDTARREIAAGDLHGVRRLLTYYGGMGSINDAYRDEATGEALGRAYRLAQSVLREQP